MSFFNREKKGHGDKTEHNFKKLLENSDLLASLFSF